MTLEIPDDVHSAAIFLLAVGYQRAEAYPIDRWRERGWPEDERFFRQVDCLIKLIVSLR